MLRLGSVLENSARYEESIVRMLEGVQLKNAVELEQTGRGFRRFPRPAGKVNVFKTKNKKTKNTNKFRYVIHFKCKVLVS